MITKENITDILKELSKNEKPYMSEAQFQFELAWELQKKKQEYGIDKILLEYTACAQKLEGGKKKRFESDIIVLLNNKKYIAIELKYKTSEAEINGVKLIQQAGQPGTKYDYLWDVRRIELLMKKQTQEYEYYMGDNECVGGYAIFLTNDSSYYTNKINESSSAYNFRLCDNRKPIGKLNCNVADGELKDWMKSREAFELSGNYEMKWEPFNTWQYKNKEFKYLITEIIEVKA